MNKQGIPLKFSIAWKYHLLFWLLYFLVNVIRWGSYFNDYTYSLKSNLVEFPLHLLVVYFHIYFLVPALLLKSKKNYLTYIGGLVGVLAVHYVLRTGLTYFLVTEDIWPEAIGDQMAFGFNHIVAVGIGELYVIALTSAIKFTVDYIKERDKNQQLENLQYQTELKYLKAQIQPHFFFNTLNNLYALTLKASSKAPEVVLQLSDIMRYIIYEANKKHVPLLKEIEYIDNYVALESLRFEHPPLLQLEVKGDIEDVKLPPLLFLPFVENAFKHGLRQLAVKRLRIRFKREGDWLVFQIKNPFDPQHTSAEKGGIGLNNMKRRLDLLYKQRYSLKNQQIDNTYKVTLKIPL